MADEQGLRIILSPVQLSAVLQGEAITSHDIAVNRFWGAAKVVVVRSSCSGQVACCLLRSQPCSPKRGASFWELMEATP